MTEVIFGCDPELFIQDKKGRFVSAHDAIPGTKAEPFILPDGMMQVDGMAIEFGVRPTSDKQVFISRVNRVRREVDARLSVKGYKTVVHPSVTFSKTIFDKSPDVAKELGCNPDYNAYTGKPNPVPKPKTPSFRTAGGHIHIGWTNGVDPLRAEHFEVCRLVIKMMDHYLGIPSVLFDGDTERRSLYGAAGAFRPTHYGCEYRSLSCAWLRHPSLTEFVFDQAKLAMKRLEEGAIPFFGNEDRAQGIINGSKALEAFFFCRNEGFVVPPPPEGMARKKEKANA
jgi:hypothetical protein